MLEVKEVSKRFGRKQALRDVNFRLEEQVYGLLGANGAGKTTLIRCLCGLYRPNGGEVTYEGQSIGKSTAFIQALGYLPQSFGMFRELTLYEMMDYFCALKSIAPRERKGIIDKALEMVNLADRSHTRIAALSGGMMRRAGIAQTLLGDTKVLLYDEPTAGLDPEERARFKTVIAQIKTGRTILISTHIVEDIEASCEQVIVLHEGKVLFQGSCQALRSQAEGHVYLIQEDQVQQVQGEAFVLKTVETDEGVRCRVLSQQAQDLSPQPPTLEDGYMCKVKGLV